MGASPTLRSQQVLMSFLPPLRFHKLSIYVTDFSWNFCLIAEKLVKEQASVKTDLEMAV